jgi:hypothetical protein
MAVPFSSMTSVKCSLRPLGRATHRITSLPGGKPEMQMEDSLPGSGTPMPYTAGSSEGLQGQVEATASVALDAGTSEDAALVAAGAAGAVVGVLAGRGAVAAGAG